MQKKTQKTKITVKTLKQHVIGISLAVVSAAALASTVVFASGPPWMSTVQNFLRGAAYLIGGGLVVAGLIMYGIGQSKDDASQKSTGIMMAAGGIIVAMAGTLIPTLFTFTTT